MQYSTQDPIFVHEITEPNKISAFWQLPQIMIITAGEIMFSITSLKFAFCQVILNTKFHNNSAVLDDIFLHTVSVRHFLYDFMYDIELTWDLV